MTDTAAKRSVKPTQRRTSTRTTTPVKSRAKAPAAAVDEQVDGSKAPVNQRAPRATAAAPKSRAKPASQQAPKASNQASSKSKVADPKKPKGLLKDKTKAKSANQLADKREASKVSKVLSKADKKAANSGSVRRADIGIAEAHLDQIAEGLSRLLADTYTLYLKTHNFHWNVTGPMFNSLHQMFETQYTELALAVDSIAERIRTLGYPAPGSYKAYAKLSSIKEADGVPDAAEMIRQLMKDQEAVVRTARSIFPVVDKASDEPTADLLTQRMQVHEKTAWMLRSMLS